jgi:cytochrome c oxidase cbb3-type subunit 3
MKTNKLSSILSKGAVLGLVAMLGLPYGSLAQAESSGGMSQDTLLIAIMSVLVLIVILLVVVAFFIVKVVNIVIKDNLAKQRAAEGIPEPEPEPSWLSIQFQKLWGTYYEPEPETILMDHDYDGIQELDNHLPPWWKYLFYLTVAFGFVYVLVYHVFDTMPLQEEEYQLAMEEAAREAEMRLANVDIADIDESNVQFVMDDAAITEGATLFSRHCVVCHGAAGEGGIGPNLTDEFWIHGGEVAEIFSVIKYGVQEKGMIPWQTTLNPEQMQNVTSYIITLEGTNPPNAKAPEGQPFERVMVEEESTEEEGTEQTEESTEESEETSTTETDS